MLHLRSEDDLGQHIIEILKRGNINILVGQEYTIYNLLNKSEYDFIEMLEKNIYDDIEDMVYRVELTKNEIIDTLNL